MKHSSQKIYKVVGIGEVLWDKLPEGKRLGGAPANFALHASALGAEAKIVSAVGADYLGREILQQLSQKSLDSSFIMTNGHETGAVEVTLDKNGHAEYLIKTEVAWDYIRLLPTDLQLARECDAVCFGSLAQRSPASRESLHRFLAHTRKDCLRVFDINLRQSFFSREVIESSLEAATVLKLNDYELVVLQGLCQLPAAPEEALQCLRDRYALDFIALTRGDAGSIVIDRCNIHRCPGFPATVKDTVGAGDSFTAALVLGRLNGLPLDKVNQLACKIAAYVCSQAGATPGLPAGFAAELRKAISVPIREIPGPLPVPSANGYNVPEVNSKKR